MCSHPVGLSEKYWSSFSKSHNPKAVNKISSWPSVGPIVQATNNRKLAFIIFLITYLYFHCTGINIGFIKHKILPNLILSNYFFNINYSKSFINYLVQQQENLNHTSAHSPTAFKAFYFTLKFIQWHLRISSLRLFLSLILIMDMWSCKKIVAMYPFVLKIKSALNFQWNSFMPNSNGFVFKSPGSASLLLYKQYLSQFQIYVQRVICLFIFEIAK